MTTAVCIVLDVGIHMQKVIDHGLDCLKSLIQRRFFSEKREMVAVILCGTTGSDASLTSGVGEFPHISIARELSDIDWDLLEFLSSGVSLSPEQADVMDALVVGVDHLLYRSKTIKRLSEKHILLVSNLEGPNCHSTQASFFDQLCTVDIHFNLLGRSFREEAFPNPSLLSTPIHVDPYALHKSAYQVVYELWLRVGGESYTFTEALPALARFETRTIAQRSWRVDLRIGASLSLPVEGFVWTKEARTPCLSFLYAADPSIPICPSVSYLAKGHSAPIASSQVIRGYRYGDALVSFSDADIAGVKLPSEKCLDVLGFTSSYNVPRNLYVGDAVTVFGSAASLEAGSTSLGFCALTQALAELDEVALVRRVYNKNAHPRLGILAPEVHNTHLALIYNDLGFAEDFRTSQFAELPITAESSVFSSSQLDAMESFVDSMLLGSDVSVTTGDKGHSEAEVITGSNSIDIKPEELPNPWIQRLFSCFRERGLKCCQSEPATASQNLENHWLDLRVFPGLEALHDRVHPVVGTKLKSAREGLILSLPTLTIVKTESMEEPIASAAKKRRLMLDQLFGQSSDASVLKMPTATESEYSSGSSRTLVNSPHPNSDELNHANGPIKSEVETYSIIYKKQPTNKGEHREAVLKKLSFHKQLNIEDLVNDLE